MYRFCTADITISINDTCDKCLLNQCHSLKQPRGLSSSTVASWNSNTIVELVIKLMSIIMSFFSSVLRTNVWRCVAINYKWLYWLNIILKLDLIKNIEINISISIDIRAIKHLNTNSHRRDLHIWMANKIIFANKTKS